MPTKYPAIYARCKQRDLEALARVARRLRRTESDTVRFLINTADEKLRAEIKRASTEQPENVTASLTEKASGCL